MSIRLPTDRPYRTRDLTLPELRSGDIHSYQSPKEGRLVRVSGIARIAQALLLEFNPDVIAYAERPRVLSIGKQSYEICFWLREISGRERMLMILGSDAIVSPANRRANRQGEELYEAAKVAHLPLELVMEREVLAQRQQIALAYRLLPSVQSALELANRSQISEHILKNVREFGRMTFTQLEAALTGYQSADVGCVAAFLLHSGELKSNALDRMTRSTVLEVKP